MLSLSEMVRFIEKNVSQKQTFSKTKRSGIYLVLGGPGFHAVVWMKIALIGYGKMGKAVEKVALAREHTITNKDEADLWIDFSHKTGIMERIEEALALHKPFVIGTTDWQEHQAKAEELTNLKGGALFVSPNFSLGLNLFLKVLKEAQKLIAPFKLYDTAGFELHHNQKKDSPSGTARLIAEELGLKEFAAVRVGHIPGTHTVLFDSSVDTITITHEARSREGFALGAVIAAEWLTGKKGFFTMRDLMEDYA